MKKYYNFQNCGVIINQTSFTYDEWRIGDGMRTLPLSFNFNEILFKSEKKKDRFTFDFDYFISAVKCITLIFLEKY